MEKPEIVTEEHLIYLDGLRESGVTNMYGAGEFLEQRYDIESKEAREILGYWMKSYGDRHSKD